MLNLGTDGGAIVVAWRCILAAVVLVLGLAGSGSAQESARFALLIGNQDYKPGVGALANPLNDIRVVGEALKSAGFQVMAPVANGTRAAIVLAVIDFAAKLKATGPNAIGFLYYSGHGVASGGENTLIP